MPIHLPDSVGWIQANVLNFNAFARMDLYLWTQSWCLTKARQFLIIKPSHNMKTVNLITQFILHLPVSMYIYTLNLVVYFFGHLEFVIVVEEDISNLLSLCSNKNCCASAILVLRVPFVPCLQPTTLIQQTISFNWWGSILNVIPD